MKNRKINLSQLRASFWDAHPQFAHMFKRGKRQNSYTAEVRCAFVDYVDAMQRDEQISEKTAFNATL